MSLHLDWCSHEAAKYAAKNWHYSGCLPASPTAKIGVCENDDFIGAITYSKGATPSIGSPLDLEAAEITELTRVALTDHNNPVTRMLSVSRKLLNDQYPNLRATVSYADPHQNHNGAIYQADNWVYTGRTEPTRMIEIDGEVLHSRSVSEKYGTSSVERLKGRLGENRVSLEMREGKHRYFYPLDDDVQERAESMSEPYPDGP